MKFFFKIFCLKLFSLLPKTRLYGIKTKLLYFAGYTINNTARLVSTVEIFGPKNVYIGEDTFIGHDVLITGSRNSTISIGNFVDIAPKVIINTGSHEIDMKGKHTAGLGISKDIMIKDGVWIGMGAIILPGVTIGKKSIVAAGAVVVSDVPPYSMVAGNPAKVKKQFNIYE